MRTHMLWKVAARLAVLAVLALAGDRLLALGIDRVVASSQLRFSLVRRGGQSARVIVLGDSRGVNGFYAPELTRLLRAQVLNLSYNALSTRMAEALLRDYLARSAPPRLLVLEITNVEMKHDELPDLRCYWNGCPELGRLAGTLFPVQRMATRISHLYGLNGEAPLRALYFLRRSDQDMVNHYRIEPALLAAVRVMPGFELTAREDNLEALGRIVRLAREKGIEVRLAVTPNLPDYVAHATNRTAWLARVRQAADGEPIWDYGRADSVPAHFADRVHLNDLGASLFAARLVRDGFFGALVDSMPGVTTGAPDR
jgi:hypothetical protein